MASRTVNLQNNPSKRLKDVTALIYNHLKQIPVPLRTPTDVDLLLKVTQITEFMSMSERVQMLGPSRETRSRKGPPAPTAKNIDDFHKMRTTFMASIKRRSPSPGVDAPSKKRATAAPASTHAAAATNDELLPTITGSLICVTPVDKMRTSEPTADATEKIDEEDSRIRRDLEGLSSDENVTDMLGPITPVFETQQSRPDSNSSRSETFSRELTPDETNAMLNETIPSPTGCSDDYDFMH